MDVKRKIFYAIPTFYLPEDGNITQRKIIKMKFLPVLATSVISNTFFKHDDFGRK